MKISGSVKVSEQFESESVLRRLHWRAPIWCPILLRDVLSPDVRMQSQSVINVYWISYWCGFGDRRQLVPELMDLMRLSLTPCGLCRNDV